MSKLLKNNQFKKKDFFIINNKKMDEKDMEKMNEFLDKLPRFPKPIFELNEKDKEYLTYKGDIKNIKERLKNKIYQLWVFYDKIHHQDGLIVKELNDTSTSKDSKEFELKSIIVNMIDQIAKILTSTDLLQELFLDNE